MRSKNAAKNIVTSLLLQAVMIVYGFVVPRLIISAYGSEVNGLVNSITQFLAYITLLESGFGPVVKSILYKPIAKNDKSTIESILKSAEKFFRIVAGFFLIYIAVLCVVYPLLVENQFEPLFTISLLVIMAVGTFTEYFFGMTYQLYLQAGQRTYISSAVQIGTTLLNTIIVVLLIKFGFSIQIVKIATAIIFVARPLLYSGYVKKKYGIKISNAKSGYVIKQKWDGLVQHIAAVIHGNTDVMVLTIFSTLKEVSVYSIYMVIIKGVKNIIQAFSLGIDASFGDMMAKKEHETLNRRFSAYELFYHTVATVLFICTIVLITPFVSVYMNGVTDADYVRPIFGVLITISEFLWAIKMPYSSVTLAAGHFKETRRGAWIEAITNIILSVILVFHFGIIGVAIGTIVAMAIRMVEFMYHNSKYILKRSVWKSFSWILVIAVESIIGVLVCNLFVKTEMASYWEWLKNAIMVVAVVVPEVAIINAVCYHKDVKQLGEMMKKIIKREGK